MMIVGTRRSQKRKTIGITENMIALTEILQKRERKVVKRRIVKRRSLR